MTASVYSHFWELRYLQLWPQHVPFSIPLSRSGNPMVLPPKEIIHPIRVRLKTLCLKVAAGTLEEVVNCVDRRQTGQPCPWRRAALCVGAFVRFCVPHAPHHNAHSIHRSYSRKCGSALFIPVASCLEAGCQCSVQPGVGDISCKKPF